MAILRAGSLSSTPGLFKYLTANRTMPHPYPKNVEICLINFYFSIFNLFYLNIILIYASNICAHDDNSIRIVNCRRVWNSNFVNLLARF